MPGYHGVDIALVAQHGVRFCEHIGKRVLCIGDRADVFSGEIARAGQIPVLAACKKQADGEQQEQGEAGPETETVKSRAGALHKERE